ncbi:MAG: hypothetical protein J6K20_01605 [Thermoguttaceae bacterium]|nr:hypothetical protein [Thermoguttaceae bacterium]
MSESLFQISCPSCESVFAVTDPELVGQIIACPKCGGMMLVEAAKIAQNSENAVNAEAGEVAQDGETAQDASVGETARNGENDENSEGGEETASDVEENVATVERSRRSGKFVGGGIALALVGALAFAGLRGVNDASTPVAETENGKNSEEGGNGKDASDGAKNDVGGFAPFAVEERTGENEDASELWGNDSAALEDGENALSGESGENETLDESGENAQDLSVAANDLGEKTTFETENGEDKEDSENSENVAIEASGENASNVVDADSENASGLDGSVDDLEGLGDLASLEKLNEGESLDVEEDKTDDALENVGEEMSAEEKLAGSNDSTGFNEADFERANQNDDPENADEPAEVDWSGVASTTNPTLQGALPTLRRERKEIDVDARLALPIKSVEFPSSPVAAVRLLSEFTGVSIVPELETFVLTRPSTSATLDLSLRDATAGEALEKVAELLNWEVCKEKDRVLIRPSDYKPETLVEERFDVADLTTALARGNDETRLEMFELPNKLTAEALGALIKSTVAPETWTENGGKANLAVVETTLAITQNAQNRENARILLEGLRAIRGLETQGNAAPERIIPEKLGWEKLTKKMTFAPLAPLPLQNAIEILERAQKFQVFWDDAALLEAGVGRDLSTAARIENGTLDAVLREILEPLNATYIILGDDLIFITNNDVAEEYQTVEFFSLIGENGERPTLAEARALVEEIKVAIAPESWKKAEEASADDAPNEENGENAKDARDGEKTTLAPETEVDEDALNRRTSGNEKNVAVGEERAAIWLDVESACLIVRQSQPNQRALRRWLPARLANWANEGKEKAN